MKKRTNGFELLYTDQQQSWRNNGCCPICGKPKTEWKRRTDWACCSLECSKKHNEVSIRYWPNVRHEVFKRDNHTCAKCGFKPTYKAVYGSWELDPWFIADHITPIALGGDEWDMNNLQTLCEKCNKEKTRRDKLQIAFQRRLEKATGGKALEDYDV